MSDVMEMEATDNLTSLSDEQLEAQLRGEEIGSEENEAEEVIETAEIQNEVVSETPEQSVDETAEVDESNDEELDPVQKELAELKKVLGRQGQELGELRKYKSEAEAKELAEPELAPDEAMDEFVKNPTEFIQKQSARAELDRRQAIERERQAYETNLDVVKNVHPDFEDMKQDIVDYAKGRGEANASMELVEQLVAVNPGYLNLFIDKMKMEKEVADLRSIVTGNRSKSTKSAVASKRSVVKGPSSSQKTVNNDVTDFTSLSDSELEAILKG